MLIFLLIAPLAAGCGVSKSKYVDLTKSRDSLLAQTQQLETSLNAANKEKAQLSTDKAALEKRNQEMEAVQREVTAKLEEQAKANQEMQATYTKMLGTLEGEVNSGKVQIEQMRDGINLSLAQEILFPSGSANLDKQGRELLLRVAGDLKDAPSQVNVIGHTDNQKIGASLASRYPTNWELGAARATQIVRLFEQAGITKDRLAAVSFSDGHPRESNETPDGRAKNRRIEIRLRPLVIEPPVAGKP
jgi:chemotaxis protein MotB